MVGKYQGIDTAAIISHKSAKILRENGISFVVRYLVPQSGVTAWKALSAVEAKNVREAGLAVMLCWELTADRMLGGAEYGATDGAKARELAEKMGVPHGTAIYFAADWNVKESEYDDVDAYLSQVVKTIGDYRVGLYGHEKIVHAMSKRYAGMMFWQCVAWSNQLDDAANVFQYQWQGGDEAKALAAKCGFAVDLDSADSLDGMWEPEQPRTEEEDAMAWAKSVHIVDDSMRDVSQTVLMLYRYFKTYQPEDGWSFGVKSD